MNLLCLDYETFFDSDFTLSKLTNESYIRDPRFETIMVGLKMNDNPAFWVPAPKVAQTFAMIPWDKTAVLSHHSHFDMAILSWVYGIQPAFILDTIPMFRALYPTESAALSNMVKVLGLPDKGHEILNAKGKHLRDFSDWELRRYGDYCVNDVEITRMAFDILKRRFPVSELRLIDLTTRLFTEPVLGLNGGMLQVAYDDERQRLLQLFVKAFPDMVADATAAILTGDNDAWKKLKTPLSSNEQFAEMLYKLGVDPPKKLSPAAVKKGIADPSIDNEPPVGLIPKVDKKTLEAMRVMLDGQPHPYEIWTYALAKSDEEFKQLLDHPDDQVATLAEARLGVKSTIKETRAKAFMGIASRGTFPIYLKYYGAHTGRDGGGDKVNPQNLNRACPHCDGAEEGCPRCDHTGVSPMRRSIEAPEGHVIIVRDLSAIEARVNFYLAGQDDKVEAYRQKQDLYCLAASQVFGREVTKKMKRERFLGKAQILGCGFGLGYKKFQGMIRIGMLGNAGMLLDDEIAMALGVAGVQYAFKNSGYLNESLPPGVSIEDHATHCACAQQIIKLFRDNNPMVVKLWERYQNVLADMLAGGSGVVDPKGVIRYDREGLILPNDMKIRYTELQGKPVGNRTEYSILKNKRKGERAKVYGGLCTENGTQGVARIIITDAFMEIDRRLAPYRRVTNLSPRERIAKPVHRVHDEILVVGPQEAAEEIYQIMGEVMSTPPSWAPDLPLASEGGWARNYIK